MKTTGIIFFICTLVLGCGCSKSPQGRIAESTKTKDTVRQGANEVEIFERAVEASLLKIKFAEEFSKITDESSDPELVLRMEQAILTKSVRKQDVRGNALAYVSNMRNVIAVVRESIPDKRPWADRMEPLLARLESVAR